MVKYRDFLCILGFTTKYRKISEKVSAVPICRLEWDSKDPPLFPGLLLSSMYCLLVMIEITVRGSWWSQFLHGFFFPGLMKTFLLPFC
jgi:hypothetical protein